MSDQSLHLAYVFACAAREARAKGDNNTAIAGMECVLAIKDLPNDYRRDATAIMDLLLRDCFKRQ